MGAGQSDLYEGTYGVDPNNIPEALKGKVKLPPHDDQIKHIMADRPGHLPDTPENRKKLVDLANDIRCYKGTDIKGNNWHYKEIEDGSQLWVEIRDGVIQNGGINKPPRSWDPQTGLNRNIYRRNRK